MEAVDTHKSSTEAQQEHQQRQSVPIDRCFDKFTECEQLGKSELWYCAKCKAHRQVRPLCIPNEIWPCDGRRGRRTGRGGIIISCMAVIFRTIVLASGGRGRERRGGGGERERERKAS